MSDNVALPALSGSVATDEVAVNGGSSAHVQFVKLVDGTANGTSGLPGDSTLGLRIYDGRAGTLSNARTTALDDILLVKGSAGVLYGFQGYTDDDGFVVVIADADGTISGGAQCLEVIHVVDPTGATNGGNFSLDFGHYGVSISTGICIAFSSTGPTFTNGGNHMFVSAQYV